MTYHVTFRVTFHVTFHVRYHVIVLVILNGGTRPTDINPALLLRQRGRDLLLLLGDLDLLLENLEVLERRATLLPEMEKVMLEQ